MAKNLFDILEGAAEGTVDAKNRITVPTKFREAFENERLVLWGPKDKHAPCLILATREEFGRIFDREYSRATPQQQERVMRRFQVGRESVDLDKNARFVLPPRFFAKTGIRAEEKVFFIGCCTYLEIWALEAWDKLQDGDDDFAPNFAPDPEWLRSAMAGDS
ncbi:MAG: hypothetical protein FWH26_09270 [Oscillospiraceae bacterium]|nr:hypothetical protein [Oscillospiraceae bacterium]